MSFVNGNIVHLLSSSTILVHRSEHCSFDFVFELFCLSVLCAFHVEPSVVLLIIMNMIFYVILNLIILFITLSFILKIWSLFVVAICGLRAKDQGSQTLPDCPH